MKYHVLCYMVCSIIVLCSMEYRILYLPTYHRNHFYDVQDIEFYNSLKYILDNDPEPLCLHFTATRDHYGEVVKWIVISL